MKRSCVPSPDRSRLPGTPYSPSSRCVRQKNNQLVDTVQARRGVKASEGCMSMWLSGPVGAISPK